MENKTPIIPIAVIAVLLAALGGSIWFLLKTKSRHVEVPVVAIPAPVAKPAPSTPVAAAAPKSIEDFKVGPIKIQRPKGTKGSRLVYAIGALTNTSSMPRLGVRIELDLLDAQGAKVDNTSDYQATLAPGEVWTFHAVVHEPLAVSAKVAKITEDN
jgi:hypothetical protein